jgi:hypothetical protein
MKPATSPSLAHDDRGAIMVLGIFMCATLVGALWYIAGVGDALVYRERLQEAADAAAMSCAALNARGMNLIVFLNLIMACVLAIRVALKTIQAALIVAEVVFAICAVIPFNPLAGVCGGLIPLTGDAIEFIQNLIEDTREPINSTLKGLHAAQKAIKAVTPGGSVAGTKVQLLDKYKPFIVAGFDPIPSMASPQPETILPSNGLPVEDGSLDKLCGKAGAAVGSLIDSLIPIDLGDASGLFSGIMEDVAKAGGSWFCELGGSGSPPNFDDLTNKTANKQCDEKKEGLQKQLDKDTSDWRAACGSAGVSCTLEFNDPLDPDSGIKSVMSGAKYDELVKSTKPADKATLSDLQSKQAARDKSQADVDNFKKSQCVKDEKKQINDKLKKVPPAPASNGNGMEPMKVKKDWKNGIGAAQTLSLVNGEDSLLKRSPHGVRVGAQKDKRANVKIETPEEAKYAYAQGEYFYDCDSVWTDEKCNKDEEAMWHFRWRARLRRYNNPWTNPIEPVLQIAIRGRAIQLGKAAFDKGLSANIAYRSTKLGPILVQAEGNVKTLELH